MTVTNTTLSSSLTSTDPLAFCASWPVSNSNVFVPISRLILIKEMVLSPSSGKGKTGSQDRRQLAYLLSAEAQPGNKCSVPINVF